jgi:hypothetical protein
MRETIDLILYFLLCFRLSHRANANLTVCGMLKHIYDANHFIISVRIIRILKVGWILKLMCS